MEFIALHPPRIGTLIYYHGDSQLPAGPFRVVDNDEYNMTGEVIIKNSKFSASRSAIDMDILEVSDEFLNMAPAPDTDGVTFLPSEDVLRKFGFTDHREGFWYYSARVDDRETLNITIPKAPFDHIKGEPVYSYNELVMDEDFGQPAYFGRMVEPHRSSIARRVSEVLGNLRDVGIQITVNPEEYAWENWPEAMPILGVSRDEYIISKLEKGESITP
jgi:hypothetical protein